MEGGPANALIVGAPRSAAALSSSPTFGLPAMEVVKQVVVNAAIVREVTNP
jgi:hypothetical protein